MPNRDLGRRRNWAEHDAAVSAAGLGPARAGGSQYPRMAADLVSPEACPPDTALTRRACPQWRLPYGRTPSPARTHSPRSTHFESAPRARSAIWSKMGGSCVISAVRTSRRSGTSRARWPQTLAGFRVAVPRFAAATARSTSPSPCSARSAPAPARAMSLAAWATSVYGDAASRRG